MSATYRTDVVFEFNDQWFRVAYKSLVACVNKMDGTRG